MRAKHCRVYPAGATFQSQNLLLLPLGYCCPNLMKFEKIYIFIYKFALRTHPSGPGSWPLWSSVLWSWYQSWQCGGCWCPWRLWHCASGCRSGACLSCLWSSELRSPGRTRSAGNWNQIFNNMSGCSRGQEWKDMKARYYDLVGVSKKYSAYFQSIFYQHTCHQVLNWQNASDYYGIIKTKV